MTSLRIENTRLFLRWGFLAPAAFVLACGGRVYLDDGSKNGTGGSSSGASGTSGTSGQASGGTADGGVLPESAVCDGVPRVVATVADSNAVVGAISVSDSHFAFTTHPVEGPLDPGVAIYAGTFGDPTLRPISLDTMAPDPHKGIQVAVAGKALFAAIPVIRDSPVNTVIASVDLTTAASEPVLRVEVLEPMPHLVSAANDWTHPEFGNWIYGTSDASPTFGAFAFQNPATLRPDPFPKPFSTAAELVSIIPTHPGFAAVDGAGKVAYGYFGGKEISTIGNARECERYVAASTLRVANSHAVFALSSPTCDKKLESRIERAPCTVDDNGQPFTCADEPVVLLAYPVLRDFRVLPDGSVVAIHRTTDGVRPTERLVHSDGHTQDVVGGEGVTGSVDEITAFATFGGCIYWAEPAHDGQKARILRASR